MSGSSLCDIDGDRGSNEIGLSNQINELGAVHPPRPMNLNAECSDSGVVSSQIRLIPPIVELSNLRMPANNLICFALCFEGRSCQNKASGLVLSVLTYHGNAGPDVPFNLLLILSS